MEVFGRMKALARYKAGFKGGPFYKNPRTTPAHNFEYGYPESVRTMTMYKMAPSIPIMDVWSNRRSR